MLREAQTLKIGSFELQLRARAVEAKLASQLGKLKDLTPDQLQLFLIIGKLRSHIGYSGQEVNAENLEALKKAGRICLAGARVFPS